jgi:hypothetical protein
LPVGAEDGKKSVAKVDTPVQPVPAPANGALHEATTSTRVSARRITPRVIAGAVGVVATIAIALLVLPRVLNPSNPEDVLSRQALCLESAEATLVVSDRVEVIGRIEPGKTLDVPSGRADFEILLDSAECPNLRESLTYAWRSEEGSVTKARNFPWTASYLVLSDSSTDTISVSMLTSDNYKRDFGFFINFTR